MISEGTWVRHYDFESGSGFARIEDAERRARKAYAGQVLQGLLENPIRVVRDGTVACVILFGRLAYVMDGDDLSVASHRHGVLTDFEMNGLEAVESLPLSKSVPELKSTVLGMIMPRVASCLGEWRGELIDIRSMPHGGWALDRYDPGNSATLEGDMREVLEAIPMRIWKGLLRQVATALGVEEAVASSAGWALLGEPITPETYKWLSRAPRLGLAQESGIPRVLIAHVATMAYGRRVALDELNQGTMRLRRLARGQGVNAIGWRLLLQSSLPYWSRLMKGGYDETTLWIALLAGQAFSPARLPDPKLVRLVSDLAFENEIAAQLRNVPPQVWRALFSPPKGRPSLRTEASEVLAWACATGATMPKTMRGAGWSSLARHGFEHALASLDRVNAPPSDAGHQKVECDGICARRIVGLQALQQVARFMQNCVESLADDIQSGSSMLYYAAKDDKRAVILVARAGPLGAWAVVELKGPANRLPDPCFVAFAHRICDVWNADGERVDASQTMVEAGSSLKS